MAAKGDEEGAAPKVVGLALSGSKSSAHVLRWALGNFANDDAPPAAFKLIHVLTPVLAVPTPMGHLLPIDEVGTSVAEGELEKMWIEKQEMLQRCNDTCDENKVEAQVLLVEGKDVADTISSLVSQYQIHSLVVGNPPSKSPFTRRSTASRTACKICKSLPSFCTAYVVSKDGLSSVHVPESESGSPSGSPVPKGNSGSSSTEESTDGTPSRSDLDGSSAPGLPSFTLNDYLTGNAPVHADKDRRIASRTGAESSILSQLRGSDKVPTSSPQELMLSDNKIGSTGEVEEEDADSAEENETAEEETENVDDEETENADDEDDNEDHPRRAIVGPVPWIGDDNLNWGAAMLRVTPQQAAQLAEAKLIKELLEAGAVSKEETRRYPDVPAWVRHRPQPEIDAYQVLFARFDEATMTRLRMVQLQRKGMGRHANYSAMDKELKELRELISEAQDELKILCGRIAFKTPGYLLQDPQAQKKKKHPKDPQAQKREKIGTAGCLPARNYCRLLNHSNHPLMQSVYRIM